jgi:hypothetical protein
MDHMPEVNRDTPPLWIFGYDVSISAKFDWYKARNHKLGMHNQKERSSALWALKAGMGHPYPPDIVLPDDFPPVRLALPEKGFSPDYFGYGGDKFCSRRLREAMDLPEGVVQFMPVDLVAGGAQVRAQEYQLMRVIAHQPAIDLERSVYDEIDGPDEYPGQPRRITWVGRYVFLDGLRPATEIFRTDETYAVIFVTDALAERVLRAGCTGMEFCDPTLPQHGDRLLRYRTATGVAERWV